MTIPDHLRDTITNNFASPAELSHWGREGVPDKELARPALNSDVILVDLDSINALNNRDGLDVDVAIDKPMD